jgi:hypothetical protein
MTEYPIPHREHYEPCTLRKSYKSAFLHPEEDAGSHKSAMGADEQNTLKIVSPSPIRGKQTSLSKRAHKSMANGKSHLIHTLTQR